MMKPVMQANTSRRRTAHMITIVLAFALTTAVVPPADASLDEGSPWWWPTQGDWVETQALAPNDPGPWGWFGSDVAVDGDTLVASVQLTFTWDGWFTCPGHGKPSDHPEFEDGCDWVYVFNRGADDAWEQTAKLVPSDAQPGDTFGWAVAVDEEAGVIVVGNPGRVNNPNEFRPPAMVERVDKVYIFERQANGSWIETAAIHKSYPHLPEDAWTLFGLSVAVSGHTVAATDAAEGRTYVFEKTGDEWVETAALEGGGGPEGVGLAGDTLMTVKGWGEEFCGGERWNTRPIVVYNRVDGEWVLTAEFEPETARDKSQTTGTRRALSDDGTTIVIGAAVDRRVLGVHTEHCAAVDAPSPVGTARVHTRSGALGAVGSAWVYELVDGEWVQTADIPNPMPNRHDVFGVSVEVSGDIAVIGADGDTYNGGMRSGAAYVYEKAEGEWFLTAKLRNHDSDENDLFGHSVAVSGATVVVGAPFNAWPGSVHVFEPLGPAAALPDV